MRVLHILAHGMPRMSGYAVRSHSILCAQKAAGLDVCAVCGPYYGGQAGTVEPAVVDGVEYHRVPAPQDRMDSPNWVGRICEHLGGVRGPAKLGQDMLLLEYFRLGIENLAARWKPDILHAHSPYRCILPAYVVGRRLGLPVVYEVRGLWEDSGVMQGNIKRGSLKYRYHVRLEQQGLEVADVVVAIGEGLRADLIKRGVPEDRCFVVPNAVEPDKFVPREPDGEVIRCHQLRPNVLGYIGSHRQMEGIEYFIDAFARIASERDDVSLLLVGDDAKNGPLLRRRAEDLGVADRVVFAGRVPFDQVARYYSVINIFCVTRPSGRATELVTPLKPLEAMAMGKAVIGSSVGGIRELLDDEKTGLIYEAGNVDDLARQIRRLLDDPALRDRLAASGREHVISRRNWTVNRQRYDRVYEKALSIAQAV